MKQAIAFLSSSRYLLPIINQMYERLPQSWVRKIEPVLSTPRFDYTWKVYIGGKKLRFSYRKGEPRNIYHFPLSYKKNDPSIRILEAEIHKSVPFSKVCFDVGANFGLRSLYYISQGRQCFLFEPNTICNEITSRFLKENNVTNASVISKAIGDRSDKVRLYRSRSTYLTSVYSDYPNSCDDYLDSVEQEMMTLDQFVSINNLTDKVGILKVDVEGFEKEVCEGAAKLISSNDLCVIIEISCSDDHRREIFERFQSAGYKVFGIHACSSTLKLEQVGFFEHRFLDFLCLKNPDLEAKLGTFLV